MKFNKYPILNFLAIFCILTLSLNNFLFSQTTTAKKKKVLEKPEGNNAIAIGLTTNSVFGISSQSIYSFNANTTDVGGSFKGAQPGIELRYTYSLDEEDNFRIPIGVGYEFFSAREKIPLPPYIEVKLRHDLNIISPYAGFEYKFFKLPKAKAYVYGGVDFKAFFIKNAEYQNIIENLRDPEETYTVKAGKEDAARFGMTYRIGVEGALYENYEINTSIGLNVLNIAGKDAQRGELLTPIPRSYPISTENRERTVYGFYVSILLQYRF